MHKVGVKPGILRGTAVIRDKHGNIKGHVQFEGETELSKEELEAQGLKFTDNGDSNGRDTDHSGA